MAPPLIYFSYGMTKSGSTLSYELARSALVLSGLPQPRLSVAAVEDRKKINFCNHIDETRAAALRAETAALGHTIAIKTHTRPDPVVVQMLENNEAFAHATFRDPREIALSMIDHGIKSREKGQGPFAEYHTVHDAAEDIKHQTNSLLSWLSLPNVRPLYYDDVAFDMAPTAARIADDLGVSADIPSVMNMASNERFTQRNKAEPSRHKAEMAEQTSQDFLTLFAPMYDHLIEKRHDLPNDGRPILDPNVPLCDWSLPSLSATGLSS